MSRLGMGILLNISAAMIAVAAGAEATKINLDASQVKLEQVSNERFGSFTKVTVPGFENNQRIGHPSLPVRSWLVVGAPENIQVDVKIGNETTLRDVRPLPAQPQECRCEGVEKKPFAFDKETYDRGQAAYRLTYVGAFRGQAISRIEINMATYDAATNSVVVRSGVEVETSAEQYSMPREDYRDYLIVVPQGFESGVQEFVDYKKQHGFNVIVEKILTPANDTAALSAMIKKHYTEDRTDYVILVGDMKTLPMFTVGTSGSSSTPTDLTYFTMDGGTDHVPDMFYSRIGAANANDLKASLAKSIEFEQRSFVDPSGLKKFIGIASNEGSNPSDKDYVTAIQDKFMEVGYATSTTFLYQKDTNSNPNFLNTKFKEGAFWLTYLGHGSGTSWPSMNRPYSVSDITKMTNKDAVKPIIIDVACMNGRFVQGYLGTSFLKVTGEDYGAAAYYGGTVNISWHPPAVMARGIAFEHAAKRFKSLGEALLAGQLYLAANWTDEEEVVDNFEWYHLQGDPGMNVEF